MNNKINQRELLILRHGKSSWDSFESDFDRTLTEQGQEYVKRVAISLQQNDLTPDYILSSPALRAIHTATIVCHSLGINADTIHTDSQIYNAQLEDLLNVITQCPEQSHRVLLVGHNPSFEELVDYLRSDSSGQNGNDSHLSPATLAHLQIDNDWQQLQSSCANLVSITHAKHLADAND